MGRRCKHVLVTTAAGALLLLQTVSAAPVVDWTDKTYDQFDIHDGTLFKSQPDDQTGTLIAQNKINYALKVLETRLSTYGDLGTVLQQTPRIIKAVPKNRRARELMALALGASGDVAGAKEQLAALPATTEQKTHILLAAEAMIARRSGNLGQAKTLIDSALAANSTFAYTHSLAGLIALEQQELPTALAALEIATTMTKSSGPYFLNLGTIKAQSGDQPGAKQAYATAFELMDKSCEVAVPLARYHLRQEDEAAARDVLKDCLAKTPESDQEAFAYYAAMSQTEDPSTIFKKALYAERLGRDGEAQAAYERFVALEPENYAGLNQLAWFYAARDMNLDKAMVLVTKALELRPGNASALDTKGWLYFLKGDHGEAVRFLEQAYAVSGNASEEIMLHLAKARNAAGDQPGAEELLKTLAAGEKDSPFKLEALELLTPSE